MYHLYQEREKKVGAEPVYSTSYCEIFRTEFNVGFHDPSIDSCDFCVHFENMTDAEKVEQQVQYDGHRWNKMKVKSKLSKDKEEGQQDKTKLSICFSRSVNDSSFQCINTVL